MKNLLLFLTLFTALPVLAMESSKNINNNNNDSQNERPTAKLIKKLDSFLTTLPTLGTKSDKAIDNNNNNSQTEHSAAKPIENFSFFENLPRDVLKEILRFLGHENFLSATLACFSDQKSYQLNK